MSLPRADVPWPPPAVTRDEQDRWADLYAGRTIGKTDDYVPDPDLANVRTEQDRERRRVRGGLASDIAATSASLVMGKGAHLSHPDETADDRLAAIETGGLLHARLLEAAEIAAAFGGVYLRAVADPAANPSPYITAVDPSRVDPVFVDGRLVAATIWTDLRVDGASVWRWVEHRDNRTRTIEQGLYRGTTANLGSRMPLESIPETVGLTDQATYPTGIDRMVWYVPNVLPNRRHPSSPHGRADIQGAESLCAAVDVVLTSLVRDVRLGRARMVVPTDALTPSALTGGGSVFNPEREIYTTLDVDPSSEAGKPHLFQGAIRTTEHIDAALAMVERAVAIAGYSPQTFGLHVDGAAQSGTALRIREARTIATVEAKRRYWTPVVADIAYTLLALDAAVYGGTPVTDPVVVDWDAVRDDNPLEQAQVIETLSRARALSVEAAVRRISPDLTEDAVSSEVQAILTENGLTVDGLDLPGEALFTNPPAGE